MTGRATFVIVGAGLAGAKAAETLRQEGFAGRVVLLGEEPVRPYERPPLSKDYLRGEAGTDKVHVHDEAFYAAHDIELRLSARVESLDVGSRSLVLASGETLNWDALLLATGAAPRGLAVPGADLDGVRYLRGIADADGLRGAIATAGRTVVIGAGWIGCEVAASARQMGAQVAMVDLAPFPLQRVLGPEVGRVYRDLHAEHGVELHLGTGIEALRGEGRVREVVLADGTVLEADLVVVGVGVTPRAELAGAAGLALDNGVPTDEYLATSAPGVWAAGDVANAWHPLLRRRIRLEHWSAALNQGPAAARNMLGHREPYERLPYFFSDQYDTGMEYIGHAPRWDRVVLRGDVDGREFIAFWLASDRVAAAMNLNVWDVGQPLAALVGSGRPVDPRALADRDTDLGALASAPDVA